MSISLSRRDISRRNYHKHRAEHIARLRMRREQVKKEKMSAAWSYRANITNKRVLKEGYDTPIGLLAVGCPKCTHVCSFDFENMRCERCGWKWQDEKKNMEGKQNVGRRFR